MPSPEECAKRFKVDSKKYKECILYKDKSKKKKASNQTGVEPSGEPNRRQYGY